ncbi:copper resistance D family protein [Antrihabitans sp. YC2-6]|uniref:copper resistance D family protein n=1 Tax=Antrihabitans sp. YC2-6 TaxID=2799498 RepID=UPI0018F3FBDC|nr:CopD family protein [Antrihabitans sp. YC2-6]MBJ8346352.1 CopD family protein [Antrihabitans sp. YC2-6]
MASTAGGTASRWALLLAVLTAALGVSLAWNLSDPANPDLSALVRVIADCMAALVLGLAALLRLQGPGSRRSIKALDLWRPIAAAAGVWVIAEVALLLFEASSASGRTVAKVGTDALRTFVLETSNGQVGLAAVACALAVVGYASVAFRQRADWSTDPVLAVAALALVLRPITGHMSQQTLGPLLGAVHALAAGLWFGLLVAMGLIVQSRGGWAELLPRFSNWALWCVVILTGSGIVNAFVRLQGITPFFDSGYGRIVVAKTVVLAGLVGLGWYWRRTWVREASGHRMTAAASLQRAIVETMLMATAFGLAAALAGTA